MVGAYLSPVCQPITLLVRDTALDSYKRKSHKYKIMTFDIVISLASH